MTNTNNRAFFVTIILGGSAAALREHFEGVETPYGVVEAEWGSEEVIGSEDSLTLNHHVRPGRTCPCLAENTDRGVFEIGVSHADLDTLGGVLALQGLRPEAPGFWRTAAFVDTHGPHRVEQSEDCSPEILEQLQAWWAWSQANRLPRAARDGVLDVTEYFRGAAAALTRILDGDAELLAAGEAYAKAGKALDAESFRDAAGIDGGGVILRSAPTFTNHLYAREGWVCSVIVAYNSKFKSVTVSREGDHVLVDCCKVVQDLWGSEAGGHAFIAGSPRGTEMSMDDARDAFEKVVALLGC